MERPEHDQVRQVSFHDYIVTALFLENTRCERERRPSSPFDQRAAMSRYWEMFLRADLAKQRGITGERELYEFLLHYYVETDVDREGPPEGAYVFLGRMARAFFHTQLSSQDILEIFLDCEDCAAHFERYIFALDGARTVIGMHLKHVWDSTLVSNLLEAEGIRKGSHSSEVRDLLWRYVRDKGYTAEHWLGLEMNHLKKFLAQELREYVQDSKPSHHGLLHAETHQLLKVRSVPESSNRVHEQKKAQQFARTYLSDENAGTAAALLALDDADKMMRLFQRIMLEREDLIYLGPPLIMEIITLQLLQAHGSDEVHFSSLFDDCILGFDLLFGDYAGIDVAVTTDSERIKTKCDQASGTVHSYDVAHFFKAQEAQEINKFPLFYAPRLARALSSLYVDSLIAGDRDAFDDMMQRLTSLHTEQDVRHFLAEACAAEQRMNMRAVAGNLDRNTESIREWVIMQRKVLPLMEPFFNANASRDSINEWVDELKQQIEYCQLSLSVFSPVEHIAVIERMIDHRTGIGRYVDRMSRELTDAEVFEFEQFGNMQLPNGRVSTMRRVRMVRRLITEGSERIRYHFQQFQEIVKTLPGSGEMSASDVTYHNYYYPEPGILDKVFEAIHYDYKLLRWAQNTLNYHLDAISYWLELFDLVSQKLGEITDNFHEGMYEKIEDEVGYILRDIAHARTTQGVEMHSPLTKNEWKVFIDSLGHKSV